MIPPAAATATDAVSSQIRGSSLLLVGRFLAIGSNLAIQVLIVRFLSKADFGAFAYALAVTNFLAVVVTLGLDQTVTRFAALYDEQSRHDHLLGAIATQAAVVSTLGIAVVVAFHAASGLLADRVIDDSAAVDLLVVMAPLAPLLALDGIVTNMFAVYGRPAAIFVRRYLVTPGLKMAVVLAVLAGGMGIASLARGYIVATAAGLVVYGFALGSMLVRDGRLSRRSRVVFPGTALFRMTGLVVVSDLVVILLFASDAVLVGYFGGTEQVAHLQAVQPVAAGNQIIFMALLPLFIPLASRLFARGDDDGLAVLVRRSTLWAIVFASPVLFLTVGAARPLTNALFGSSYDRSVVVLALLSVGNYLQGAFGLSGLTLKVVDKLGLLVVANIAMAAANIGLNIVLIPRMGAAGAATGTMSALVLLAVIKAHLLRRVAGITLIDRPIIAAVGCSAVVTGGLALLDRYAEIPLLAHVGLAGAAGLAMVRLFGPALGLYETFPTLAGFGPVRALIGGPPTGSAAEPSPSPSPSTLEAE